MKKPTTILPFLLMCGASFAQRNNPDWLKNSVFYQIYPSSYQDSNGDGFGDIKGVQMRLDYIKSIGVNAIWFNPVFKSAFQDGGYANPNPGRPWEQPVDAPGPQAVRQELKGDWKLVSDPARPYPVVFMRWADAEKFIIAVNPSIRKVETTIPSRKADKAVFIKGNNLKSSYRTGKKGTDLIQLPPVSAAVYKLE